MARNGKFFSISRGKGGRTLMATFKLSTLLLPVEFVFERDELLLILLILVLFVFPFDLV